MNETELIGIISIFVTLVFGFLAKRFKWVNSNLIPLQNLAIGIIAAIINYIITKDFSLALSASGLIAGGAYDVVHNISKVDFTNTEIL